MSKIIKVTLEFNYIVGEDISDWDIEPVDDNGNIITVINTEDEAIAVAMDEIIFKPAYEFNLKSEIIDHE